MCAKRKSGDKKKILFSDEFYSDLTANDMIHAVLVRSPFSCGKITSIGFSPKTKMPEGYTLLTFKDFSEKNEVSILGTKIPLLCTGEIAYKGEIIGILAGEDKEILEELKSSIRISLDKNEIIESESKFSKIYNNLPHSLKDRIFEPSPIEKDIIPLREGIETLPLQKEIIAKRKINIGNTEGIFDDKEKAAFKVEGIWENKIRYNSNKETEGCLVQIKGGNLYISTPTQWISQTLDTLTAFTGFPREKIFLTQTKISSHNTNSLWQNGILASLATLIAIKTGKNIKLSLSRKEQEEFIELPPDIKISHKTALDQNGIITAMEISIDYDSGSKNPFASYILERLLLAACGIYNCKNVKITAKAYSSHTPPSSQNISRFDAQAFFAAENQIQKIAEITGFSPIELRQMNKAGSLQKSTTPFTFAFGRSSDAINAVAIRSDFKRKYTVSRLSNYSHLTEQGNISYSSPLRGIGLACAFDGSGYLGTVFDKANISLQLSVTEDKKIIVHALPPSLSIKEIWTKIILDDIEIDKRNILFTNDDAEDSAKKSSLPQLPDCLIGNVSIKSVLLKKCVDSIKRKKIDGTPFSVKKSLSSTRKKLWNQEDFSGTPFYNTAFGTCTVEVELDECTFRENLRKISVIIDGGKILNPKAAENAIHRKIQHCLASLVDGDALKCPVITVQFTQSEEEPKQIGGLIYSILPAAYASALSQAVASTVEKLPLKTESLFTLIERHENSIKNASEEEK